MIEIMRLGQWGTTWATQLEGLQADLDAWYKLSPGIYKLKGKLTIERLRSTSGYPKLKAKAADTRHIARYLLELATRFNSKTEHDERRLALVTLLVEFYDILMMEGRFFSAEAKQTISQLGKK
jgi:CRP-like cAMP-binding protein